MIELMINVLEENLIKKEKFIITDHGFGIRSAFIENLTLEHYILSIKDQKYLLNEFKKLENKNDYNIILEKLFKKKQLK